MYMALCQYVEKVIMLIIIMKGGYLLNLVIAVIIVDYPIIL